MMRSPDIGEESCMSLPARSAIVQNAYVVRDLDEACTRFHRLFGIGELYTEDPVIRHMYRQAQEAALRWSGSPLIIPWQ